MFILSPGLRYKMVKLIDEGSQGKVHQALDRHTGDLVALKVYHRMKETVQRNGFDSEVSALRSLRPVPGVLQLYDTWKTYDQGYLVTELCNGSLDPELYGKIESWEVREVGQFLLRTLDWIHQKGYQHNDVKPANILRITSTGQNSESYRLCDFGLSIRWQDREKIQDFRGTVDYIAPEYLNKEEILPSGECFRGKVDIWSAGVSLYELYTGTVPFYQSHVDDTLDDIQNKEPDYTLIHDPELKSLLQLMLLKDPEKRPTAQELLSHRYFQ
jgi:serine/threonine protein kinase